MANAIILFATKYGSTQQVAEQMSLQLGVPCKNVKKVADANELKQYDLIILGAPVYSDGIFKDMKDFIANNYLIVGTKKVVTFVVYGVTKGHVDVDYTKTFAKLFSIPPLLNLHFVGRVTRSSLSKEDYQWMEDFYANRLKVPMEDFDYYDPDRIDKAVAQIRGLMKKHC